MRINLRLALGLLLASFVSPSQAQRQTNSPAPAAPKQGQPSQPGRCHSKTVVCIGLVVHTVQEHSKAVVPRQWLAPRIQHANRLFAVTGVEFFVAARHIVPAQFADMRTRSQRDSIGTGKTTPGAIDLFLVRRLADVDIADTVIRGVHWRKRGGSGARWIIMSSIAPELVLAHELGHYFGLPHSTDGRSLMNKQKGGGRPPWPSRSFRKPEHQVIRSWRDKMLSSGRLRAWTAPKAASRQKH